MAIIDSKLAAEESRRAREYAERNDTPTAVHSQDWQQPPPAYEEASGSSQRAPQNRNGAQGVVNHAVGEMEDSEQSEESTPLLSRHRRQNLKKRLRVRHKIKKGLLFISISLLLACIALLLLDIVGLLDSDDITWPEPPASDGVPVEDPIWSPGVIMDPDLWPSRDTPLYSSKTNFSFDAFNSLFLRERDNGGIKSGLVVVASAGDVNDEDWKRMNRGTFFDQIYVEVEARYSEVALLKGTRVSKMRMDKDKEGVGIYGSTPTHSSNNWFLFFHVIIFLPMQRQRTEQGMLGDGTSFISDLDIDVDNMRLTFEALQGYPNTQDKIAFGNLKTSQMNSVLDIVYGLKATGTVAIHLQNGSVRDIASPLNTFTIVSPHIHIEVINGHIWLNKLIAKKDMTLKTTNGGINITGIAISERIQVKHSSGLTGGTYRAGDVEIISRQGGAHVDIDLGPNVIDGEVDWYLESDSQPTTNVHALARCQRRNVQVFSDIGEVNVHYRNHNLQTRLNSRLESGTGSVIVHHNHDYEGTLRASTKLGSIEIHGPHGEIIGTGFVDNEERKDFDAKKQMEADTTNAGHAAKYFVLTTDKRGPLAAKLVEGRTWFSDHRWENQEEFCVSKSIAAAALGRVEMYFD